MTSAKGYVYHIAVTHSGGTAPAKGYPALYLLDGNAYGPLFGDIAALEAGHNIGRYLIVSVGYVSAQPFDYAQRQRDYTLRWSHPETAAAEHIVPSATGGADDFSTFLLNELRPAIVMRYLIDNGAQTLFGHSLGGLFALHLLFTHPDAFAHYIAASPSIWWDGGAIQQEARTFLRKESPDPSASTLLMTAGTYEQALSPAESQRPDAQARLARLQQRRMLSGGRSLAELLQQEAAHSHLHATFHEIAGEGHISSTPAAASQALQIAFPTESDK